MDRYSHIVFLVFGVVTFLLGRYDFAVLNFVAAFGFAISELRGKIIHLLKLEYIWDSRLQRIGSGIGFLAVAVIIVMVFLKFFR